MNISQAGIKLISNFEGCSLKAYKPVAAEKYYTIGFGHYGPDVKANETITQAQADALLKQDLANFVAGVNACVKVPLNSNQFDALVSFAYNCGLPNLEKSTLLQYVNAKEFSKAAQEFGRWIHGAGGVTLQGLINRRAQEAALFSTPVPTPHVAVAPKNPWMYSIQVICPALNIRKGNGNGTPNPSGAVLREAPKGEKFHAFHLVNGMYEVGGDYWVSGKSEYVAKV